MLLADIIIIISLPALVSLSFLPSFFFLAKLQDMWDLISPDQGSNLCPMQWKC